MSSMVIRWVALFVILTIHESVAVAAELPIVTVSYDAPSAVVLHQPVVVEVRLSNQSTESVRFDLGFNRQAGFALRITPPDGGVHRPAIAPSGLGRIGRIIVNSHEEISHQLVLNDWFQFDRVGVYEIVIQLTEPIRGQSGSPIAVPTTGQFQVLVRPEDPIALQQVCRDLTDTIVGSRRAEDRLTAARALSYVDDPVVLPFVQEILTVTTEQDALLIKGLSRVKHQGARSILLEMVQSANKERAALSRDALRRLGR